MHALYRLRLLLLTGTTAALWGCTPTPPDPMESFQLQPGFAMTLAASEPLIFDPVDMAFDEKGRAFVVEMPGYPMNDAEGKIVLLEDSDGNGQFDTRLVFADSLGVASSLMAYRGGFLVASPPDLIFLKDTDGDDRADTREIILSGFSYGNLQHNFNGLTYGLDNQIYIANGGNSGNVYWPQTPDQKLSIRGSDLRIDLENQKIELFGRTSGGFELAMDEWGNFFGTHNTEHISHIVFPGKYMEGTLPGYNLDEISDHSEGELARIYPIGKQDTRVNHPEQSGYFSGACGITYYGANAFPQAFNGNIFVADVVLNLIHRDVIHPDGPSYRASREDKEREFLASSDRSFRPVNMITGPDGALYVLDMHRKVIEHPEWIPDEIEDTLDLNAGKDAGRIYRITPEGGLPVAHPSFARNNLPEVVAHLSHPSLWYRITAQRLLVEWHDEASVPILEEFFAQTPSPQGKLHALWTMAGIQKPSVDIIIAALSDDHPEVRAAGIQLSEAYESNNEKLLKKLLSLENESQPKVVMQLLLTLSALPEAEQEKNYPVVRRIMLQHTGNPWMRMAIAVAGKNNPSRFAGDLLAEKNMPEGSTELLEMLSRQSGQMATENELLQLLKQAAQAEHSLQVSLLNGLSSGVARRDQPLTSTKQIDQYLGKLETTLPVTLASWQLRKTMSLPLPASGNKQLQQAAAIATNREAATAERVENLELMAFGPFAGREELLFSLLNTREPQALQSVAIRQLRESREKTVGPRLVEIWSELGPETRKAAGDILLYQEDNHPVLLSALETGKVQMGEMNFHLERRRELLFSEDESVRKRAKALFSDAGVFTRKEALDKMKPALSLKGNAVAGKLVFTQTCNPCHRHKGEGNEVGPELTEIYRKSGQTLMHDILDPNAAADNRYISHTVETVSGEVVSGIVMQENDDEVVLRQMNGQDRSILRRDIRTFTSTGLSLMPEGLENAMTTQQMADLLAFLQQAP
ncbi:MAG: c-type cytochrome [Bacteroidia bacterium]